MKYGELNLGQIEAIVNKLGGMDGVHRFLAGSIEIVVKKILTLVATVKDVAVESFVALDKFREGKTTDGVRVAWFGDNFKKNFLGKTEKSVAPTTLRIQKLEKNSPDAPILTDLGDTADTFLANLWELLKKQGSGQKGILLVNGYANIFYIRDVHNELWAVHASWDAGNDGWYVGADSVTSPGGWDAGCQVVSR